MDLNHYLWVMSPTGYHYPKVNFDGVKGFEPLQLTSKINVLPLDYTPLA